MLGASTRGGPGLLSTVARGSPSARERGCVRPLSERRIGPRVVAVVAVDPEGAAQEVAAGDLEEAGVEAPVGVAVEVLPNPTGGRPDQARSAYGAHTWCGA